MAERSARRPARRPVQRRPTPGVARRRRLLTGLFLVLLLLGFLFTFVYPTRTFLQQRRESAAAQHRFEILRDETKRLERDSSRLRGDAEVERLARERYGLVRPGETPYVVVPVPAAEDTTG